MTSYVALLRGINPMNPNMRNEKLRGVFERLGFTKVQTVIASGNVLFQSKSKDEKKLEASIEKALLSELGLKCTTIVRSHEDLSRLVAHDPFKGGVHSRKTSLNITFLKNDPALDKNFSKIKLPYRAKGYTVLHMYDRALASVVDLSGATTPDLMLWLEKTYGKQITTRTWKTIDRLLKKL